MRKLTSKAVFISAAIAFFAFAFCGCAANESSQPSTISMTASQALQKSAELRQQVQDAKAAANTAQAVNNATGATKSTSATIKEVAKDTAKEVAKPVLDEYNSWKGALK